MALPQHFMDELRRRVTLSDVIGKRVVPEKAGQPAHRALPVPQ